MMMTCTASILPALVHDNIWLLILVRLAIIGSVFLGGVSLIAMFSIWWERKVSGHIQGRLGPMQTGGWHGWAQSLADGIKLIQKEDLIPKGADAKLFKLAPYLAFGPVFAAFVALPFAPQFCFEGGFNNGLLYILAILAVEVMAVILAGWGSNSKWAIYGAMREACQMVSYEVPLGLTLICGILAAGTLNLVELGYLQGGGFQDWFLFHNPFLLLAFFLYFVASLASSKRAPFDLPESESELVAGFHTEYSGLRFSFFFFAEYAGMFVIGVISAFVFLGGWNSPLGPMDPIYMLVGYDPLAAGAAYAHGAIQQARSFSEIAEAINQASGLHYSTAAGAWLDSTGQATGLSAIGLILANLYSVGWVIAKAMSLIFVQMWLRWTLPRIRIDQVMYACVKVLLPSSLICLVGTAFWIALVPQGANPVPQGASWGHLLGSTPGLQGITQWVLMLVGLGILASMGMVVLWAWLTRDRHPKQSFFDQEMPVGNTIAFNPGPTPTVDSAS